MTSPAHQPITGEYLCDGVTHHDVRFKHATNQLLQLCCQLVALAARKPPPLLCTTTVDNQHAPEVTHVLQDEASLPAYYVALRTVEIQRDLWCFFFDN